MLQQQNYSDTEPEEISYIKLAAEMNLGKMDLSKLNINRIIL